jgi:hypothetical protein
MGPWSEQCDQQLVMTNSFLCCKSLLGSIERSVKSAEKARQMVGTIVCGLCTVRLHASDKSKVRIWGLCSVRVEHATARVRVQDPGSQHRLNPLANLCIAAFDLPSVRHKATHPNEDPKLVSLTP